MHCNQTLQIPATGAKRNMQIGEVTSTHVAGVSSEQHQPISYPKLAVNDVNGASETWGLLADESGADADPVPLARNTCLEFAA